MEELQTLVFSDEGSLIYPPGKPIIFYPSAGRLIPCDPTGLRKTLEETLRFSSKFFNSKYLQWENHSNSMKLEAQTLAKIKGRINEKVMKSCGTWIDWQYLLDAAALLAKCRYTLQYTYPYAYYMEPSNRKKLVRKLYL